MNPTVITDEQLAQYRDKGYVVLRELLSPETAAELRGEVMGILDQIGLPFTKLKQTTEYLPESGLDHLVSSGELKEVAAQLMEGPATLYMPFTAVKSGGGGGRFHFHQDNQYTQFDGPGINLWFALEPMRPENGALQVVPRSHLHGTLPSELSGDGDQHKKVTFEPEDFVTVEMEPGDCIAFSRLTVHGSGQNTTDQPRVAYAVQFHRNDVNFLKEGEWISLLECPRWQTGPVAAITVPKTKLDGH